MEGVLHGFGGVLAENAPHLIEQAPNWAPMAHLGRGHFQQLRGAPSLAREEFERCVRLSDPREVQSFPVLLAFCPGAAAYVECLIELGQADLAKSWGEGALATLRTLNVDAPTWELERAVALAEGKLQAYDPATARLQRLIAAQRELGVRGLHLGASYEARTRIAIWAGDKPAIAEYGRLTALEYHHGASSPLAARYERLLEEAERAGVMSLRRSDTSSLVRTPSEPWRE